MTTLPNGWKRVTLADLAAKEPNAIVDGPFGSNLKLSDYVADGVPVLQGKNITGNIFQWFDVRFIKHEKAQELKRSLVRVGDILIVKIGSIGYSAVIDDLNGYSSALIPANLCKLTPNRDIVDVRYLVHFLHTPQSVLFLTSNASATSQPALSLEKVKQLPVILPPLPEQQRIAALLDRADRLRRTRRYAHQLSDSFLQAVFVEMFGDVRINPRGWDIETLDDLETRFDYGTSAKCDTEPKGLPVLRIPNILHGSIDLTDLKYAELPAKEADKLALNDGDLIFVRTNGNPDYVGRCAVFDLARRCLFASYLIRAKIDKERIHPQFALAYLKSRAGRKAMSPYIRTTAGQSNIGMEGLGQIPMPLPPLPLQQKFARIVQQFERLRAQQREAERQAEHLFQTLLQRAFRGGV